jgi:hypothetical protein
MRVARHTFNEEQVDAGIDAIIERAKDRGQTIRYSAVFAAAGLPEPQQLHQGAESQLVTDFMKAIHDRCMQRGLPPLDSLVVHVAGPRQSWPGGGYFKVNGLADPLQQRISAADQVKATRFWEDQKEQCKEWGIRARRAG